MKLIDILVQELPKRGGWPHGSTRCMQTDGLYVTFPDIGDHCDFVAKCMAEGSRIATREQYEAALAACKPEWNGEGVPPVGTECEYSLNAGRTWFKCKIDYVLGTQGLIMLADVYEGGQFVGFAEYDGKLKFRPIRSEADKRRDEIIGALKEGLGHAHGLYDLMQIYHLLNNGKIPHIRID